MDWTLLALPIGGAIRSIAGWAENALKDGKVDRFELKQLAGTIVQVSLIGAAVYFGFDYGAAQSASIGVLLSFVFSAIKAKKK